MMKVGLIVVWGLAVGAGFLLLLGYKNTPGAVGPELTDWPASAEVRPDPACPNLVLFAHPHCPCTRASLEELDRILTRGLRPVRARVLFVRPGDFRPGWEQTALWRRAESIPGVEALADPDGAEARHFGARTSGHVLLFGADGRLLFSGGITGSRGHEGDNPGASAVRALLAGDSAARTTAPVFGCALEDS